MLSRRALFSGLLGATALAVTPRALFAQTTIVSSKSGPRFDWNDAGVDRYRGTRKNGLAQSGWPQHVQDAFLKLFDEDTLSEKGGASEGKHYTTELIPSEFNFEWMMFGANTRRSNVVAHTLLWPERRNRTAKVYRVEDPVTMYEYVFFSPLECNNASGNMRKILYCICPDKTKVCSKK